MQNLTPTPDSDSNTNIKQNVTKERIRQAKNSFNLYFVNTVLSTLFGLTGATMLLIGHIPEGSITTSISLASSLHCSHLAKDANDRLDKLLAELDDRE